MCMLLDASPPPAHHFGNSNVLSQYAIVGELWSLQSDSLGKELCLNYIIWKMGTVSIFLFKLILFFREVLGL